MKPTDTFKLNKENKIIASRYLDKHERGKYLRSVVSAQLCADQARKMSLVKDREVKSEN